MVEDEGVSLVEPAGLVAEASLEADAIDTGVEPGKAADKPRLEAMNCCWRAKACNCAWSIRSRFIADCP